MWCRGEIIFLFLLQSHNLLLPKKHLWQSSYWFTSSQRTAPMPCIENLRHFSTSKRAQHFTHWLILTFNLCWRFYFQIPSNSELLTIWVQYIWYLIHLFGLGSGKEALEICSEFICENIIVVVLKFYLKWFHSGAAKDAGNKFHFVVYNKQTWGFLKHSCSNCSHCIKMPKLRTNHLKSV